MSVGGQLRERSAVWDSQPMVRVAGYLGIDVGGTKVALRVESNGIEACEASFTWSEAAAASQDLEDLADNVGALLERWGEPIAAVGVALPATLDSGRVVTWPGRPSWAGLELGILLRDLFPDAEVSCADDGDIAAVAEAAHANCRDLVYLGVGTGIGGGIILDGRPCPGTARGSCEIGHLVIDRFGPQCDCGRRGCVQAMASGPATLRRANKLRGREITFAELREAWLARRPWAVSAVRESCAALAVAIVGLTELLHPSLVVIGGGFADGLPGFASSVSDHVLDLARPGHPPAPVQEAALGGRSSLYGAVHLARQRSQPIP